jgi:hypothetical protein
MATTLTMIANASALNGIAISGSQVRYLKLKNFYI